MDLLQHLPDGLVLQEIIPRLDPCSRVHAAAVTRMWRDLSRRAPPHADDGIPWMWLSNQQLGYSLLQPAPPSSDLPNPPRPSSSRTASWMGSTVGCHGQCALIVPPPPPMSMIGPLPQPCMLLYNPFQAGESFRIPLRPEFLPYHLAQL